MENRLDEDISRLSPDSLIEMFSKTSFGTVMALSIAIHIVLTIATSTSYIWNKINPEKPQTASATNNVNNASASNALNGASASNGTASAAQTGAVASATQNPTANSQTPGSAQTNAEQTLLEQHKDSPVVKRVMEQAKPEEIPEKPSDDGIPIQDTNPF